MPFPSDVPEAELIARLRACLPPAPPGFAGHGDDCARVAAPVPGRELLLKSDPLVEGVHFLADQQPERVGRKAAARVLSDLAAAGGDPRWILVNLQIPGTCPLDWLEAAYAALGDCAARHGAAVVGGDVGCATRLAFHVFGVGDVPVGQGLTRRGARAGDRLCVTGPLGGSLRSGHHLDFTPRLAEGRALRGLASACLDLSDGLARDLRQLCTASSVGARVWAGRLPFTAAARAGGDPLSSALRDGEDYELLFTVPTDRLKALRAAWPSECVPWVEIGEMLPAAAGLWLRGPGGGDQPLSEGGNDALARGAPCG
jgi:thiamine-monophosphate kinase